jgi:ubiquinone/menaquinone biosynthesis C-methylase UbiE
MYGQFASAYDEIMCRTAGYQMVYRRYTELIRRHKHTPGNILLDLGCGTGRLTEMFAADFDVIGVDSSPDCLAIASARLYLLPDVRLVRQDMRKLDMFGTVDVTVSAFDVFNHLKTLSDVRTAVQRVKLFTHPGGVFLFDYNTPYKHEKVLADEVYIHETDRFFCSWENHYNGGNDHSVSMNINVFEKNAEGNYTRFTEEITETAFDPKEIEAILTEEGFRVTLTGFENNETPTETAEKIIFICETD